MHWLWFYAIEKRNLKSAVVQWRKPDHKWKEAGQRNDSLVRYKTHIYIFLQVLTFPIASKPLSKNNKIPRNKNDIPNPASPTPISVK